MPLRQRLEVVFPQPDSNLSSALLLPFRLPPLLCIPTPGAPVNRSIALED